jgi:hypothetical protein
MSADNGYILRKNSKGKHILQMYFESNNSYPDVEKADPYETFDTFEDAMDAYHRDENGDYWSEYGLTIDTSLFPEVLRANTPKLRNTTKENSIMETITYFSIPYSVQAVRVTEANLDDVSAWADAPFEREGDGPLYLKVDVKNPLTEKQTHAFVGDWVLKGKNGFKVYTDRAFKKSFEEGSVSNRHNSESDAVVERKNLLAQQATDVIRATDRASVDAAVENLAKGLGISVEYLTQAEKNEDATAPVAQNIFDRAEDSPQVQTFVSPKDAITGKR